MLNKSLLYAGIATAMLMFSGCQERSEKTAHYKDTVKTDTFKKVFLPHTVKYAEKRGFNDFNGDGIQDMVEINDTAFFGQEYKAKIYFGFYENNTLKFSSVYETVYIPMKKKWRSSNTKVDTADVNGDGLADIIFSQYKEGYRKDDLMLSVSLNKGKKVKVNGEDVFKVKFSSNFQSFTYEEHSFTKFLGLLIQQQDISYGEDETLYDYLKMDWADMNNDGLDDLILLWRDGKRGYNLSADIFYNKKSTNGRLTFQGNKEAFIDSFLYRRSIRNVDVEDYDGNGYSDFVVYRHDGKKIIASVALNDSISMVPNKDIDLVLPSTLDFFSSARKFDTFDMNNDGKADFNYITEEDDKQVVITFASRIEKTNR